MTARGGAASHRLRMPWAVSFLGRRLAWSVITLFLYLTIVFFFVQWWVPVDYASQFAVGGGYPAAVERYGLDRSLVVRYIEYMAALARGDLGQSFGGASVWSIIASAAPVTILVFAVGAVIAYVLGEFMGRVAAWRRHTATGSMVSVLGVLSATLFPPFLVFLLVRYLRGPMLEIRAAMGLPGDSLHLWNEAAVEPSGVLLVVALGLLGAVIGGLLMRAYGRRHRLRWLSMAAFPVAVASALAAIYLAGIGEEAVDLLYRVEVSSTIGAGSPVLVLVGVVLMSFGQVLFMMRVGIEDEQHEDYVLTARAKGLTEREVRDVHVGRNALAPALAASFLALPSLLAGMVIVEFELEVHGLSWAFFQAVEVQDVPVMMGVLTMLGLLGIALRLLTDFMIAYLDPRQRRGEI